MMRGVLYSTTGLLAGAMLALGTAQAGQMSDNVDEAKKQSQVILDWLDGKLDNYGDNEVAYDGPAFTLRSTSHVPEVSGLAKLQIQAWDRLEDMSNGKIQVETSWSQTVHSVREGRKAVRTGLSDQAPCFSLYTARDYNMVHALGLPFLFQNAHEAVATGEELYPDYLKEEFERYQVLMMRLAQTSPYNLYNNKPVRKLEDIVGMKVRAGGGTHSRIIAALGATQVGMPGADAYTAMQRGTLDAIHFNDAAALTFRLHEVADYRTINGFNVLTLDYCLNSDFFYGLPADLQNVVNNWGRQFAIVEAVAFYDYGGIVNVAKMNEETGLETIELSDAELDRWRAKLASVEAEWIAENEKKGLPAAKFVADIKKAAEKYKAMSANEIMMDAIDNPVQGFYAR